MSEDKQTEITKTTNIESTPGKVVETSRTTETTPGPKVETTTRYTPGIKRLWETEDPAVSKTETTKVERKDETTTKVERE